MHVGGYDLCVVCAWIWIKVGVLGECVWKMGVCGIDAIKYACQKLRIWCWGGQREVMGMALLRQRGDNGFMVHRSIARDRDKGDAVQ